MQYTIFNQNNLQNGFHITVDDATATADGNMTWTTNPPGRDIREPMLGVYMSYGGPVGSGKAFDLYPGGRARFHKG